LILGDLFYKRVSNNVLRRPFQGQNGLLQKVIMALRLAQDGKDVMITYFSQPDDIGGIVAFLSSEKAHWITGQRIEASGGMFL